MGAPRKEGHRPAKMAVLPEGGKTPTPRPDAAPSPFPATDTVLGLGLEAGFNPGSLHTGRVASGEGDATFYRDWPSQL